jgi:hypothetical protein
MMRPAASLRCIPWSAEASDRATKTAGPLPTQAPSGFASRGVSGRVVSEFCVMSHDSTPRAIGMTTGHDFNTFSGGRMEPRQALACWRG